MKFAEIHRKSIENSSIERAPFEKRRSQMFFGSKKLLMKLGKELPTELRKELRQKNLTPEIAWQRVID